MLKTRASVTAVDRPRQIGDLQQVLGAEIGDDQGRAAGNPGFDRARDIAAGRHHDLLQLILLSSFTEY